MSGVIDSLERAQLRKVPAFEAGDRVKVHFQVIEGNRRRTQVFEGIVIKRQGKGARETFTVRKQSFGVGVERTFPVHSPKIERIEVAARGDVRRAKLYYLRGRVGRRARVRERQYTGPAAAGLVDLPEALDAAGSQDEATVLPEETEVEEATADETTADAQPAAEEGTPPTDAEGDAAAAQAGGEGQAEETAKAEDPAASADPDAEGADAEAADSTADEAPADPGES